MILNLEKVDAEDFGDEVVMLELATGAYWSIKGGLIGAARALMAGGSATGLKTWAAAHGIEEAERFLAALVERELLRDAEASDEAWADMAVPEGVADFTLHEELSDLVKLDPIHDVSDAGWPHKATDDNTGGNTDGA